MGFKKGSLLCFIVVTDVLLVALLYYRPQEKWANATSASNCMSLSFPSLQLYSLIAVGLLRYFIQWNAHWKQEHLPSWGHFVSPCRSWPLPLYWWDFKIKTSFSKPQADVLMIDLGFWNFFFYFGIFIMAWGWSKYAKLILTPYWVFLPKECWYYTLGKM